MRLAYVDSSPAFGLLLLISACAFHFVLRDAAVTVLVELQNKLTRLVNKLAVRDLSILVFIKVAEVRVGKDGPSLTDRCEFGSVEMPVPVAIGEVKQPIQITLPLIAGVDAIMIGVPDVGSARRRGVFCCPVASRGIASWNGLCGSVGCGHQKQPHGDADAANGHCA